MSTDPKDPDFRQKVDDFAEQAQEALRRGVAKAGELAHEKADDIADLLDKTGARLDQRTEGKYAGQIDRVKGTLNQGVAKLAEQRPQAPDATDAPDAPEGTASGDPTNPDGPRSPDGGT